MGQISKDFIGSFTSDGSAEVFNLAYLPRKVFFLNKTATAAQTDNDVSKAWGFSSDPNGYAYVDIFNGTPAMEADQITSGGFSFITRDTPQFGAVKAVTSITKAASAVVTSASHGYQTGDVVWFSSATEMENLTGIPFVITVSDANTFSIPFNTDTANFTVETAISCKQVLYPDLYVPFGCVVAGMTAASAAVVSVTVNHGFVVGQRVKLNGFANYGMVEAEDKEAYVTAISDTTVTLDLNSAAYTAFTWPAPSVFALGTDIPMILPIGDENFGFQGPTPISPLGIPGGFSANTGYQVIVGLGVAGTAVMHANNDVCEVHFEFPEQLGDSISV
jgi:hypothetical protein